VYPVHRRRREYRAGNDLHFNHRTLVESQLAHSRENCSAVPVAVLDGDLAAAALPTGRNTIAPHPFASRIRFGLTGTPQSMTHTTRCTRICRFSFTDTLRNLRDDAAKAAMDRNTACALCTIGLPVQGAAASSRGSAARCNTRRCRSSALNTASEMPTGSWPPAAAHSSTKLSVKNAVCECANRAANAVGTADSTGNVGYSGIRKRVKPCSTRRRWRYPGAKGHPCLERGGGGLTRQ